VCAGSLFEAVFPSHQLDSNRLGLMVGDRRKKSDVVWKSENDDDDDGVSGNYCIETFTYYRPASDTDDDAAQGQHAPLNVKVESATSTSGGDIVSHNHDATGIMIWPATHLLCQHLAGSSTRSSDEDNNSNNNSNDHSARHGQLGGAEMVLELGCGVGLVGITAMKQVHSPLLWVSTDYDQRALDLCRRNFALNGIEVNGSDDSKVWTRTLGWGDQDRAEELLGELRRRVNESERFFDAVVGADIVYPSTCGKVLDSLFLTVDTLLAPGGTFWLSFAARDGPVTPSRLLEAASEAGFMIESLPPLNASVAKLLPPLLDSKILVMKRSANAKNSNDQMGSVDCTVFPRLHEMLARRDESSSEEEWEGPPIDSDDL
jgi:hypothetical protein